MPVDVADAQQGHGDKHAQEDGDKASGQAALAAAGPPHRADQAQEDDKEGCIVTPTGEQNTKTCAGWTASRACIPSWTLMPAISTWLVSEVVPMLPKSLLSFTTLHTSLSQTTAQQCVS